MHRADCGVNGSGTCKSGTIMQLLGDSGGAPKEGNGIPQNKGGIAMLLYDHARTERIVDRLRNAERTVRLITISFSIAVFALIGIGAGMSARTSEAPIFGGLIGVVVGVVIGNLCMVLLTAIIEWMCQLLIAHGELVETLKRMKEN
jgi:hypothetical protein